MSPNYPKSASKVSKPRYGRERYTREVAEFEQKKEGYSQRGYAQAHNIPPSTFQYWSQRKRQLCLDEKEAAFFETPVGLECLHRIVAAAQFVLTQLGGGGIRRVCTFLELSQLARFVASSYGSQQKSIARMEREICEFGQQERARLADQMPLRQLTLCLDETFHPECCLVAIDAISGFIFVEQYSQKRDASSWNTALQPALEGLNIKLIQCVSDEAKGIISLVENSLGVHSAPDLFHIQHEVSKATSRPLGRQLKSAQEAFEEAEDEQKEEHQRCLQEAEQRKERMSSAVVGLSEVYHPIYLESGKMRTSEMLVGELNEHFDTIEEVAQEAGLSEKCTKRIAKAKRVLPKMTATLSFFWQLVVSRLFSLKVSEELRQLAFSSLLPGLYLERVAGQQKLAETKHTLRAKSKEVLESWNSRDGPLEKPGEKEVKELEGLVEECIQFFVRVSSPVEGRNAQLELSHRSFHQLNQRKLGALTVVHNYFLKRSDKTTAAERFFGSASRDLFEHLLEQLPMPARPAARRS